MICIDVEESLHEAVKLSIENGFSRIPVYEEDPDDIIGVLYIKDFLKQFPSESIGETAMIEEVYEQIKLPKRSTSGSAGYDCGAASSEQSPHFRQNGTSLQTQPPADGQWTGKYRFSD